ncbi:MAG: hypothetical protein M1305_01955 [Candidatus Marsarchaeota archaeon]|nr:hypothetical protein [Candidatus Marsarchaeota archaeon]
MITDGMNIPNPNVYYEYGLMTSLKKHVIPLQRDKLKLAFNIQSYDTIKYNSTNVGKELDRTIRDAVKLTGPQDSEKQTQYLPERTIIRNFELAGFDVKDSQWFFASAIDDTGFKGFVNASEGAIAYVGRISEKEEISSYLEDLNIAIYRTEKMASRLSSEANQANREYEQELREEESRGRVVRYSRPSLVVDRLDERRRQAAGRLDVLSCVYVAFILPPTADSREIEARAQKVLDESGSSRFHLACSQGETICLGQTAIDLAVVRL